MIVGLAENAFNPLLPERGEEAALLVIGLAGEYRGQQGTGLRVTGNDAQVQPAIDVSLLVEAGKA